LTLLFSLKKSVTLVLAELSVNNLNNATAIGNGAIVTTSNTIQLGNSSVTDVKTSGTLTLGSIKYPNTAGTNGYYLKTDGSGTASWAAVSGSGIPYTGATQAIGQAGSATLLQKLAEFLNPANKASGITDIRIAANIAITATSRR
jgi:hypothetical protein